MKRLLPIVVLVALAAAGMFFWSSRAPRKVADGSTSKASSAPNTASARGGEDAGGDREILPGPASDLNPDARELTPEQAAKRARLDAQDAQANANRRRLFESNIAAVDDTIAKAEAEGANAEYLAALEQRRALLEEQAEAEAEAEAED